jgi:hypothetical protein
MYVITKTMPNAKQDISSCMGHIPRTMAELGTLFVDITKVPPEQELLYTCMGCLKGWPKTDDDSE